VGVEKPVVLAATQWVFFKEQCIHEGEEGNFAETLEGISCIKKLHAGELGESVGSIEFHGLSRIMIHFSHPSGWGFRSYVSVASPFLLFLLILILAHTSETLQAMCSKEKIVASVPTYLIFELEM
jgi:hypothetical protein